MRIQIKRKRMNISKAFALVSAVALLSVCAGCFSANDIGLSKASASQSEAYYGLAMSESDGISFDTENYLRSSMLYDKYRSAPDELIEYLNILYAKEKNPCILEIMSDVSYNVAKRDSDPDIAARHYLAAALSSYRLLFSYHGTVDMSCSPIVFRSIRRYNSSVYELFTYLNRRGLVRKESFQLVSATGIHVLFTKPVFMLPLPEKNYKSFRACSDYTISNLSHFTYGFGIGVPLISETQTKDMYKSLMMAADTALPATLFLRFEAGADPSIANARFEFIDVMQAGGCIEAEGKKIPLAFDYSTPIAFQLYTRPHVNLLSYMLNPDESEKRMGLYSVEPYDPSKIPVVFVHGLMSSPITWVQMVNTLKNDHIIRKRYQFWFFSYSSGNPILFSAARLRDDLCAAQKEFSATPEGKANFEKMIVVGHSMGGLLAKTTIMDNDKNWLRDYANIDWDALKGHLTPDEQAFVEDMIFFHHLPFVKRVVFMAVPHRGADMAQSWLAKLGSSLVSMPGKVVETSNNILFKAQETAEDKKKHAAVEEIKNGIDNLDPDNKTLKVLAITPFVSGIPYHSIIGNRKKDNVPGGSDGIVSYSSAHLDGAESELVVMSGHSVQTNPETIYEMRRILLLHLGYVDANPSK